MTTITLKEHFPHSSFQPFQEEILTAIQDNYDKYQYFILEAPPGIGKSAIAKAFALHTNSTYQGHTDIITKQIRLQEQYETGYDCKTAKGRSNFNCLNSANKCSRGECLTNNDFTCNFKPTPEIPENPIQAEQLFAAHSNTRGQLYWKSHNKHCNYWEQKMDALNFPDVVHNFTYYLLESNYVGDFGSPHSLICDECHNIEDSIMKFVDVTLMDKDLEKVGVKLQVFKQPEQWLIWLKTLSELFIPKRLKEIEEELDNNFKNYNLIEEADNLKNIQSKVSFFLSKYTKSPGSWMILPYVAPGNKVTKVEFKPLYVDEFVQPLLFKNSEKIMLMSATILDMQTFKRYIGLGKTPSLNIQVPSPFPVENRLIFKANTGNMKAAAVNPRSSENILPEIVFAVDEILANPNFVNVKGLIHTTTYNLAKHLKENCKNPDRLLIHANSKEANEILQYHKTTDKPTIILSPSMTEGVDLPNELSRLQILLKVPYLNTMDPILNARRNQDISWYYWRTALTLFQACGRSIRNPTDFATTIVLDSRISYFINKQLKFDAVPTWIRDSIREKTELCDTFNLDL